MNFPNVMTMAMKAIGSSNVLVGQREWNTMIQNNYFLTKALSHQELKRPALDRPFQSTESGAKIPLIPIALRHIQAMADDVDALRLVIEVIQREMFKNGFEVVPKYKYKCVNPECEKEYQTKPLDMSKDSEDDLPNDVVKSEFGADIKDERLKCDVCGKRDFEQPSPAGRKRLQRLLDEPQNDNNQRFEQIAKMFERDLDIFDNAYLLLLYKYKYDAEGGIKSKELGEMLTVSPLSIEMIGNNAGRLGIDDQGAEHYFCPKHRHDQIIRKQNEPKRKNCQKCGTKLLRAIVSVNNARLGGIDGDKIFYGVNEMLFMPGKYKPGLLYGYSPVFSIWSKCESLKYMDNYVRQYFDHQRPPRSLLLIGTKNINTGLKAWDQLAQRVKEDPYTINPLFVESDRGGRNMIQHVDLTGSLAELQFIEVRAEFKRSVGAMYGVLPLFSGDLPNGWSNESEEITITNRAMKWNGKEIKMGLFEPLCKVLGVEDWVIQLKESEETDELRTTQLEAAKISNAQGMKQMGFDVRVNSEGQFVFSSKPNDVDEMGAQGGLGVPKQNSGLKEEEMTEDDGEHLSKRPSDQGGTLEGSPASGPGTSLSRK